MKSLIEKAPPALFVGFIMVFAAAVRLSMPLNSPAPLNDGGLFYSMIQDIQNNGFVLPAFTSYNLDNIPLVYPPLSFYFTALLSSLFRLPLLDLLRLLPPIISIFTIPAFFLLAREMLESNEQAVLATAIFAFIPRTFDWLIMGAGLTRAPGFLFALLAIRQFYLVFTRKTNQNLLPAILFGTLTVYTHPEAATHTVIAALFFYLWKDRTFKGLGRGALIAFSMIALTAPWWLTAVLRHGPLSLAAPFISASEDSQGIGYRLISLLQFKLTDEYFMAAIGLLTLLGVAAVLSRRSFFLPAWIAVDYLLEPRGGALYVMIPAAMLAATALDSMILPFLRQKGAEPRSDIEGSWLTRLLEGRAVKGFLGFLFVYLFVSALLVSYQVYRKYSLKTSDLQAFAWVSENTPPDANFALITGEMRLRDASTEWFPALTERKSLATVFGYEWMVWGKTKFGSFGSMLKAYDDLQDCRNRDEVCLYGWSAAYSQTIEYVYIRKFVEDRYDVPALAVHLAQLQEFQQVYDSPGVVIYKYAGRTP